MGKNKGFTLIELLVSITILGILLGIGIAAYNEFNKTQTVKQVALNLKNDLRQAQNKAMAGEKPASGCGVLNGYEVSFTATSYSFYAKCSPGPSYGTATSGTLPTSVNLAVSPAGPVLFKVLGQGVDTTKTICVTGFGKLYKLFITTSGEIQDGGFVGSCP